MELQLTDVGSGKLIESNIGDTIGYYTLVHYYGKSEESYNVWQVKCDNCRKMLPVCFGHHHVDRWVRATVLKLQTIKDGEKVDCDCSDILRLDILRKVRFIHRDMIRRCYNQNHINYRQFGRKGITVCERWLNGIHGFHNFLVDMGLRPNCHCKFRLKDGAKEFNKANCEWYQKVKTLS